MAQAREAPEAEHFAWVDLGEGITFCRARQEGTALSNSGIVDLGGETLVFDTSLTLRSARDLVAAARSRTGREPTLAANSHWHLDHFLGNQLFADRPIYATGRTVEILLARHDELLGELTRERLEQAGLEIQGEAQHRGNAGRPATEEERREYRAALRVHGALLEECLELKLTPANRTFEGELALPGKAHARLLSFGSGHTESDALLYLPRARVLFAGDLVVSETHPNLTSGDPEHWLTVLEEIERLNPERIVPGHGPLGTLETVRSMRDYLSALLELARKTGPAELPAPFHGWQGKEQFRQNLEFLRSRGHADAPAG